MTPTERAETLRPQVRDVPARVERFVQPVHEFDAASSDRVCRIMASDYAETTLLPGIPTRLRSEAPNLTIDMLTPSDVAFQDVAQGKVDLVVNRFDALPGSFHSGSAGSTRRSIVSARNGILRCSGGIFRPPFSMPSSRTSLQRFRSGPLVN